MAVSVLCFDPNWRSWYAVREKERIQRVKVAAVPEVRGKRS